VATGKGIIINKIFQEMKGTTGKDVQENYTTNKDVDLSDA